MLQFPPMALPSSVTIALAKLEPEFQQAFQREYSKRRKSLFMAYVAWFLLGWHYLYLGKIGLQFAFWFTAGGFLVWWVLDFFRLPGVVSRLNEDTALELMTQIKTMAL